VAENEKAVGFDQECLDRERADLDLRRDRAETWEAKQGVVEATWRSELGRRDADLRLRAQNLERREKALAVLCRRWSERRREEIEQLRAEHRRCRQFRLKWVAQEALMIRREKALEGQRQLLERQQLIVEKASQQLLQTVENPLLAAKRIERLHRRLRSSLAKTDAKLQEERQAVAAERKTLEEAYRRAWEWVEKAVVEQRRAAQDLGEVEHRELIVARREALLNQTATIWKTQFEMMQRERADLCAEIERLAGTIIGADSAEPIALSRAA
jgi:hypothetical protein